MKLRCRREPKPRPRRPHLREVARGQGRLPSPFLSVPERAHGGPARSDRVENSRTLRSGMWNTGRKPRARRLCATAGLTHVTPTGDIDTPTALSVHGITHSRGRGAAAEKPAL